MKFRHVKKKDKRGQKAIRIYGVFYFASCTFNLSKVSEYESIKNKRINERSNQKGREIFVGMQIKYRDKQMKEMW